MFELIIQLFEEIKYFVGFIKGDIYPEPLAKEDEEKFIIDLLEKNDTYAREQLIEHNLRLVAHIAKKYESKTDSLEDLISIGIIGLIKAIDSFSNEKGVKLATYSAKCIENEILMHLRSNKKNNKNVSLFDAIGEDKDGSIITLMDVVPSSNLPLDLQLDRKNKISKLVSYLPKLDERELEIITLRYGLGNHEELTQKEVAKRFNISRSYVSRIEKRALTKLLQEFRKDN
ncbi:MAG: RNA polymerase sporulation sigma factor SigK [Bacilli bacterium]|nr:RNA polymerase sporulation sigma factor SigK [Bacilli bacterium]